ncbi:MAG: transporter associated domain-containing protein [Pseudomonadota bacterium]
MSDDQPPSTNGPGTKSWFTRLLHSISGEPRDREELLEVLREAQSRDLYGDDALKMLEGVLSVAETQARDIMIPRPHMVVLERDAGPEKLLPAIIESGHSRFPVIGEDRDEVVGILLAKDLLRFFAENGGGGRNIDIGEVLRTPVFIPESKRLNVLLKEFRDSHNHMAIVVDEYGGVAGLLTIEDVIEQIVGDIDDEHDPEDDVLIQEDGDNSYNVRARIRIEDFNEALDCHFEDEEYDTVGGLIIHELGRLPRRGESLSFGGFTFRIVRADRRRIDTVQVSRDPEPEAAAGQA